MHPSRDHHLPPDPDAYRYAPHPRGRIIVIAPTRAACETIELALGLRLETLLEREHGEEIRSLAGSGKGFGIVAGTVDPVDERAQIRVDDLIAVRDRERLVLRDVIDGEQRRRKLGVNQQGQAEPGQDRQRDAQIRFGDMAELVDA